MLNQNPLTHDRADRAPAAPRIRDARADDMAAVEEIDSRITGLAKGAAALAKDG